MSDKDKKDKDPQDLTLDELDSLWDFDEFDFDFDPDMDILPPIEPKVEEVVEEKEPFDLLKKLS